MQNWVVVDEKYLDYLRSKESRIPQSNYGVNKYKPFFGVLFEVGELVYITQISHAKPRHESMKSAPDFTKIFLDNKLVAVVNLNYMFPIHKSLITPLKYKNIGLHRTFESEKAKSQYIDLLAKELAEINRTNIEVQAMRLYKRKLNFPEDFVSRRCFNFLELESAANEYIKNRQTEPL